MANDPTLIALGEVLAASLEEVRRGVEGLSVEQLNARPAGGETNSIAVIVTHSLTSTWFWLSLAMGSPIPERDRPAEFKAVADEGFAGWTDDMIRRCDEALGSGAYEPARTRNAPWRGPLSEEPVTAAWALLHAVSHLGEHIGHIHLTRDLLRAQRQANVPASSNTGALGKPTHS
jgi:hypothetical protein